MGEGFDVGVVFFAQRLARIFVAGAVGLAFPIALFYGVADLFHWTEPLSARLIVLAFSALVALLVGRTVARAERSRRARAFVAAGGVRLESDAGTRRFPRDRITEVDRELDGAEDVVTLRVRGEEMVELRFPPGGSSAAFVHALARGRPQGAIHLALTTTQQHRQAERIPLALGGILGMIPGVLLPFALGLTSVGIIVPIATLFVLLTAFGTREVSRRTQPKIVVASDGIRWKNVSGIGERYAPLEDFVAVRVTQERVVVNNMPTRVLALKLELTGDRVVTIATYPANRPEIPAEFARRIERAVEARSSPGEEGIDVAQLDRGDVDVGAWLEALAKVPIDEGSYRARGLSIERLRELVEDAGTTTEHRLAAAALLARRGDAADRTRIRIAAEWVASPRLRIALDGMAEGEEDASAIEAALHEANR
jgi:hypothetical protein